MTPRLPTSLRGSFPWLLVGLVVSIGLLGWFVYQAAGGWQRTAGLLARRHAQESADVVVRALLRDMQAAQSSVLMSPQLYDFMVGEPHDVSAFVSSAFARHPYPETFFGVRGGLGAERLVFFIRTSRPPEWLSAPVDARFPVTIATQPRVASRAVERMAADAALGRRFSLFETEIDGVIYQVVARLIYADQLRQEPTGALGFMVNVRWARDHYFPEVISQVAGMQWVTDRQQLSLVDEDGVIVAASTSGDVGEGPGHPFELFFFDPLLVMLDRREDLPRRRWRVVVNERADPALLTAIQGARRTLAAAGVSALVLVGGLALTVRATRASARLTELRSDFVSTVTHELKTPIATIRALGDSMSTGRVSTPEASREYAALVVQEAKRLGRLVDNLLAYARITDVTEAYSFESLSLSELIDELLQRFASTIRAEGFRIEVNVPSVLPPVRADRTAMELLLDNVFDNALRYTSTGRDIWITSENHGVAVVLCFRDTGSGIPPDDLEHATRKFYRGRRAGSGGSGLGLAIVQRIVSDHGGTLVISSEVGQGTTVSITLPTGDAANA
ncbi:MAG: sensor histidine kinase [Vicinamibacterales bacterium]